MRGEAERSMGDAVDTLEEVAEDVAEHFSGEKWKAPKNPFKGKKK